MLSNTRHKITGGKIRREGAARYILTCPRRMESKARADLVETLRDATSGQELHELVVNLDQVSFIDSAGLGTIFSIRQHLNGSGARMVICGANTNIKNLLKTVNLPDLVPVVADLEAARSYLENDGD